MPLLEFNGKYPKIHPTAYISPRAFISGDVEIAEKCSVFDFASIRGDFGPIRVGKYSNIQDNCTLHCSFPPLPPCIIGEYVTVGHNAVVHGASVGNNCLVGMHSTILDGAVVGNNCIVGAGSVVSPGMVVEEMTQVLGIPAKPVKEIKKNQTSGFKMGAVGYYGVAKRYKDMLEENDP